MKAATLRRRPHRVLDLHYSTPFVAVPAFIAIHRKPHTVLRRLAVQPRTVFGDAPCLKLSVDGYIAVLPEHP
ncbi:hypothetical protein [uncultured Cardiobacterium sp.]|uniref:hypothetical protein n=1 Tax=uncultured Cardiobacterium sp. TaxID=417619 RepID=UPI00261AD840|nr:hypothetical protein [uncultured Cardiobacterium sp.]